MNHASLFSGIGGFDLAAEWMGWTNVFNCEWEEFPQRVLKHHFPNAKQYGDIKELDATAYAGRIDILTGGFPCQPYSLAGKRLGKEDERHLWPEMLRVIRECSPRWVVGENVRGLVGWNGGLVFEEVCADLEACGYSVQPFILPACGVGAPHRRDRVWFVAYADKHGAMRTPRRYESESGKERIQERHEVQQPHQSDSVRDASDTDYQECQRWGGTGERERQKREQGRDGVQRTTARLGKIGNAPDTDSGRLEGPEKVRRDSLDVEREGIAWDASDTNSTGRGQDNRQGESRQLDQKSQVPNWENFPTVPPVCGGDDGLSKELDGLSFSKWRRESIKAYGNAIVPQVAFQIFKAIKLHEDGETV